MSSSSELRYCTRCSAKLASYNTDSVCGPCRRKQLDEDFEASRRRLTPYPRLEEFKDNPEKKRLVALKREWIAQMLGKPGKFRARL